MSESLVIIRTFGNLLDADEVQVDLLSAGVYSLIFTDESANPTPGTLTGHGVALAVHNRDVDLAEAALLPRANAV